MTTTELSNGYDVLVSAYDKSSSLMFDEYEKSLFLTKAQEQLVISLYNGKNSNGDFYESSEEVRRYLDLLTVTCIASPIKVTPRDEYMIKARNSYYYKLEPDVLFIIYESVNWEAPDDKCLPYEGIEVKPVTHDEYRRLKDNPFRGINNQRVLRLDVNIMGNNYQCIELVSKYPISEYVYRYIKKPKPIILETLEGDLSIEGLNTITEASLPDALHNRLLELAVQMGLQSKMTNNNQSAR